MAVSYWISAGPAQLSILSVVQIYGVPTDVTLQLGDSAIPEGVVEVVIKNYQ